MKYIIKKILAFATTAIMAACNSPQATTATDTILEPAEYISTLNADKNALLLDVRRPEEYAEGHLPGATLLDVTDNDAFVEGIKKFDKEKTIYIYCRSGRRSRTAAKILTDEGFSVVDLKGGYNAWKEHTEQ
ncbi:MAG: rhodanese-like domain-containing protein [Bacteroidaceae bacterium]|nr:rhodanese-like domain-containing protein [Bacteroidaceae bacterium]MBQ3122427.1 rhodanese-like domain-containing protein [Bacteroidaceae bacterium]